MSQKDCDKGMLGHILITFTKDLHLFTTRLKVSEISLHTFEGIKNYIMKKYIVLGITFASLGLTAFGFSNWKMMNSIFETPKVASVYSSTFPPIDFVYKVESRFLSTITKEDLENARTILDIMPPFVDGDNIESFGNIMLSTFHDDRKNEIKITGDSEVLTDDQLRLIKTMDYGSNFYITGHYHRKNGNDWGQKKDSLVRYFTINPNKPATYEKGEDALIQYLKANSMETISVAQKGKLQPGKISFTVTKKGVVNQIQLDNTSGYDSIDDKMMELIRNMPGMWAAATNASGEKVDQKLVFFFGLMGC